MLRRSAALAYTRKWWAVLATGAQSAAIDCILGQDPQVWVPRGAPPLAVDLAWADVAPEQSRLGYARAQSLARGRWDHLA